MSFVRTVGLDENITDICWIIGNPRNKDKYLLRTGADAGFCTSTLKSFISYVHHLHVPLRFNIPGQNIYYYYWATCAEVGFSG